MRVLFAILLLVSSSFALASSPEVMPLATAPVPERTLPINPASKEFEEIRAYTNSHPNERERLNALEAYANSRDEHARTKFQHAARYADKYSQQRLAIMYWYGQGGTADPVMAYVWADLAAERGYPGMLAMREEVWSRLTPEQQAQAVAKGPALFEEFGDATAKPRLERELSRQSRKATGSRTGYVGSLAVLIPDRSTNSFGSALSSGRPLADYYAEYRWDPNLYWKLEDVLFGKGEVEVGPLQKDESR